MFTAATAIFTHATEAFSTYLKLILLAGALTTFPVFVLELYLFLRPGLFAQEDRQIMAPMCT
jgi:Sec-independent protein secretion pathway component TatC